MERGGLISHAWNDFLRGFNDPELPDLFAVDPFTIYPDFLRTEPELKHFERANAIQYHKLADCLRSTTFFGIEGLEEAVHALEGMRKVLLEDWLVSLACDCVVFPAAGDVGPANADSSFEGASLAWRNGVYYSNGNRAIRHLGIPTVSVSMGVLSDKSVPMNLTFAGPAYDDIKLLKYANAFEARTHRRVAPSHTPPLDSDVILLQSGSRTASAARPGLAVEKFQTTADDTDLSLLRVSIEGVVTVPILAKGIPELEITVDAATVSSHDIQIVELPPDQNQAQFSFKVHTTTTKPTERRRLERILAPVAKDMLMTVVLARSIPGGRPTGWLGLI